MNVPVVPRRIRRFPLSIWDRLHEPPLVTAGATLAYLAVALGGALSLHHPPGTITSQLGGWVTAAWSCFALGGGLVGFLSAPRGVWWLERVGLYAVMTFLLIYTTTIVGLQISSSGSRYMQLGILALGWYFAVSRWDRTRGAALDPVRALRRSEATN